MASVVAIEVSELRQALVWVDHTDSVIGETRATLRTIVDAETGLRGYLITGRHEFLEPWKQSNIVTAQFSKVEEMVSDNPAQKQRFIDNHAKFLAWLKYSEGMIQLRESQGNYTDFDRNLEGKRLMDDIRSGFATMVDVEQALRDTRIERANRRDGEFEISLIGLSLVLATTLVLLSRYQLFQLSDHTTLPCARPRIRPNQSANVSSGSLRSCGA
jgi:CHASE3 domain sensor protein